jgi:hypothetical protein
MKSVTLKLTSAIAMDGEIYRAGSLVEVTDADARNLLHRGKAVLATADDIPTQPAELVEEAPAEKPKRAAKPKTE